jgi:hypothetical protein
MSSDAIDSRRASVAKSRIAIRWLGSLGLVLASLAASLVLLEIGCRLLASGPQGLTHWPNLVLASRIEARKAQDSDAAYIHHPTLGFANSPNYASWALNFDAQGFRLTAPLWRDAVTAPPILATGDSFTKGDDVGDAEAWPSRLQGLLDWRTINAGVGAFGLDRPCC